VKEKWKSIFGGGGPRENTVGLLPLAGPSADPPFRRFTADPLLNQPLTHRRLMSDGPPEEAPKQQADAAAASQRGHGGLTIRTREPLAGKMPEIFLDSPGKRHYNAHLVNVTVSDSR